MLGVVQSDPFGIEVLPFSTELLDKHGELKNGSVEISVKRVNNGYFVGSEEVVPLRDVEGLLTL